MAERQRAELTSKKSIRPGQALIVRYRNKAVITESDAKGSRIKSNTSPY
jgi:hypothetical protein